VSVEGGADLFNVGSMAADDFVELVAGDAKLFGPVGDIGCHLGVDLFRVVRALDVLFVERVRFVSFRGIVVLGHRLLPRFGSLLVDEEALGGDVHWKSLARVLRLPRRSNNNYDREFES